jgi:hypothetical protein
LACVIKLSSFLQQRRSTALLRVDVLPGGPYTQVICLPKSKEKGWNCYRAHSIY